MTSAHRHRPSSPPRRRLALAASALAVALAAALAGYALSGPAGGADDATPVPRAEAGGADSPGTSPPADERTATGTATATPATPQATASPGAAGGSAQAGSPAGWGDPIFVDNFDGRGLDPSHWAVYDSPNAKQSPRSPDRATVSGGQLRLTGGLDSAGRDVSGGVSSALNLYYGRWEARFRAEPGAGYSAVMLLWPKSENWPTDGEIDLVEVSDGARRGAGVFVHNGPQNNREGVGVPGDYTQWHTVAVEWLPHRIVWQFDGVTRFTLNRPASGFNPIPTTSPMHLALQLDVGCWSTLPCRDASTPDRVTMYVDQVRVWKAPASMLG
jgi:beta-glucanase (GH16 family)